MTHLQSPYIYEIIMIDTIRIRTNLLISPATSDQLNAWQSDHPDAGPLPDWSFTQTKTETANNWSGDNIRLTHRSLGIRCWIDGSYVTTVEASLPRVLFGCNGRIIRDDTQLTKAIDRLWEILDAITIPGSRRAALSRLDLVLHLPYAPERLLPVLRHSKSLYVRRETVTYNTTSVVFPGANIRITAYDKMAEMKLGTGTFTRIEVQLRKTPAIKAHIGHRDLHSLTFGECYRAYRHIVLNFKLPSEPAQKYSEALLLAICSHHGFTALGIPVMDWALQDQPKTKRRQLETKVAKHLSGLTKIDLAACLPQEGPPPEMPDADA